MEARDDHQVYQLPVAQVISDLQTDLKHGLLTEQIRKRQQRYGLNSLPDRSSTSLFSLFVEQFNDFMVWVLIGAVIISGFLGQMDDAIAIVAIIVLNAIMGFVQEYRAERSLQALKKLAAPATKVLRNGGRKKVASDQLVPGDIIYLSCGDKVPADARLIKRSNLEVDEASLTGESVAIQKSTQPIKTSNVSLGDRNNMVYMGTTVIKGKGKAVITATGLDTEMGQIADMLQNTEERATPLQQRLNKLGKWLVYICFLACAGVVGLGIIKGEPIYKMFLAGVSLAVAAIPEGLPAIVTLSLAIGVQRMIDRQAIVRKLPSVETLGCATVICSDKTGTLTQNKMRIKKVYTNNQLYQIDDQPIVKNRVKDVLRVGAICNNACLKAKSGGITTNRQYQIVGDPTEGALLLAAKQADLEQSELKGQFATLDEIPFDSQRKRMSVIGEQNNQTTLYLKGAPDVVLDRCSYYLVNGSKQRLSKKQLGEIKQKNEELSSQALRVLALATRRLPTNYSQNSLEQYENNLVFVGLVGMIDPPRPEAKEAINKCKQAGIKPVMVTGDHKNTAQAIGEELGLFSAGDEVITGSELAELSERELKIKSEQISIYARVTPEDKLRIVKTLKNKGEIVAMTGDGVNDAPAVKEADIGIAMGDKGTDVTKEASSLILADDNFQTIVAAVEEGRAIYDNIRKFIRYLLSCNVGEILTMFLASLFGYPLPLVPIQILWVNLVTDGLPALALGVDPAAEDIMARRPRPPEESIFAHGLKVRIVAKGFLIGLSTIFAFILGLKMTDDLVTARTMAFTNLVLAQLFFVFSCRSEEYTLFQINPLTNLPLIIAVLISFLMQLAVLYLPQLEVIFKTTSLASVEWLLILVTAGSATILVEFLEMVVVKLLFKSS
ncbi:MAG: calcium-transporting P-type ATPase, PMR1-type [Bacillota bacterium]